MAYSPITSPYFAELQEWPYIKGPNYTRPVFGEHDRRGQFVPSPIARMPYAGFGADPAVVAEPAISPAETCAPTKDVPGVYAKCMAFNTMLADPTLDDVKKAELLAKLTAANEKCADKQADYPSWADCYYGELEEKWYENPLYLGGAAVGVVLLALLLRNRT